MLPNDSKPGFSKSTIGKLSVNLAVNGYLFLISESSERLFGCSGSINHLRRFSVYIEPSSSEKEKDKN